MSLFLIGMRGTGKTSAGECAARDLGVPFVDADQVVAQWAGLSIEEIFREQGEAAFRRREREALLEILPRPGHLVATGGGAVVDAEIRAALQRYGRVVWLTAGVDILRQRVRGSGRPPLRGREPAEELEALLLEREPLYRQCADEVIDTGKLSVEEVAHVIQQLWTLLPHHDLR
jgi:shikimate kinase